MLPLSLPDWACKVVQKYTFKEERLTGETGDSCSFLRPRSTFLFSVTQSPGNGRGSPLMTFSEPEDKKQANVPAVITKPWFSGVLTPGPQHTGYEFTWHDIRTLSLNKSP